MIDVAAYALLKRGITAAGSTTPGVSITDAKIENGHLILIMSDGSTIDAGALPAAGIDDTTTSTDTTWSSAQIVKYHEENISKLDEVRAAEIAQEVVERALSEFVPEFIVGGSAESAYEYIEGGAAANAEKDVLYSMDADGEPIGVKFDFTKTEEA